MEVVVVPIGEEVEEVETAYMPALLTRISMACTTSGNSVKRSAIVLIVPSLEDVRVLPRIIAPTISAATLSKTSAEDPTQSPTISPTRSAITAGFRGSSSLFFENDGG